MTLAGSLRLLLVAGAVVALAGAAVYIWAVRTQSVATLDWLDARFTRDVDIGPPIRAAYGSDPQQKLLIYRPVGTVDPPLVVFFHGGGWRNGDPADYAFVARSLAQGGYATALAGYRLREAGRYPAMLEDGAAALRWLLDNAGELGVRTDRLVLAGHSAGAYNAAMLALDRRWLARESLPDDTVKGVIGLSGPYDFYPFDSDYSRAAFGEWPAPRETQPVDFARGDAPPMLLLTGSEDGTVRPRNSRVLAQRLSESGASAGFVEVPGLDHAATLTRLARPFDRDDRVIKPVMAFLDRIAQEGASAAVQPAER